MCFQRAIGGTKKTFSAVYSFWSSGFDPSYSPLPFKRLECRSSKASEMYLRKIKPSTTCLYSAASMFLRSLSAACQSVASMDSCLLLFLEVFLTAGIVPPFEIVLHYDSFICVFHLGSGLGNISFPICGRPVSYTHLTLPTK